MLRSLSRRLRVSAAWHIYPLVPSLSAGWTEECLVQSDQIMGSLCFRGQFVADIIGFYSGKKKLQIKHFKCVETNPVD